MHPLHEPPSQYLAITSSPFHLFDVFMKSSHSLLSIPLSLSQCRLFSVVSRPVFLKFQCAYGSHGYLVKMHILVLQVEWDPRIPLTGSLVILILLIRSPASSSKALGYFYRFPTSFPSIPLIHHITVTLLGKISLLFIYHFFLFCDSFQL